MNGPRIGGHKVTRKSQAELETMRHAGRIHARVMHRLREVIEPGVSTLHLDTVAEEMIRDAGAEPSFKGYRGYPATICAELNDIVVHGIPSDDELLRQGDILGIDLGVCWEGYHSDGAFTVGIGEIDDELRRLMAVTEQSLELGLAQVKAGATIRDIAGAVQAYVEAAGFSVVRALVGHGIGRSPHEPPQVPNFIEDDNSRVYELTLEPGMVLAIEPMVNAGGPEVVTGDDGWTVRTADGSASAHYEHTVAVTEDGMWILTAP